MKPIVAIVGRANVGKSTLFNRLIGSRKAITYDVPGVTRDRHYGDVSWDDREFLCIDTGGFFGVTDVSIHDKIEEQIDYAMEESDFIVVMVDAQAGLNPLDKVIFGKVRKSGKKFMLVANKVDHESHEAKLGEFYELGIKNIFSLSSEHGLRIGDFLDELVSQIPNKKSNVSPKSKEVKIALIGKPNAGKSSLLNRLTGFPRSVVDEVAGTTRDVVDSVVHLNKKKYRLLDTMGIKKGAKSDTMLERNSVLLAERAIKRADVCLLVLDASEGISKQDTHIAGMASEGGCGMIILVNKWDLSEAVRGKKKDFENSVRATFKFLPFTPILFVSAKSGLGLPKIWEMSDDMYKEMSLQWNKEVLSEILDKALESHPPPNAGKHPIFFKKIIQTGQFPATINIHVDQPKKIHFSYERYLISTFRKALGLKVAPLKIRFSL